jgi:proline dehydrogenase
MKNIDLNNVETAFSYKSDKELRNTLFIFKLIQKPKLVKILTKTANLILNYKLPLKFVLKNTVFKVFCAGQNRREAAETMAKLKSHGVNTVLDYVAEGDNTNESFTKNLNTILKNIDFVGNQSNDSFVGVKLSGLEDVEFIKQVELNNGKFDELTKLRMYLLIERVDQICLLANEKNVKVYFDAEERSTQDVYDYLVESMMAKYNHGKVLIYNTLQMYLKDRISYLEYAIEEAKQNNYLIGMKLVRGAYVEKEREYALKIGIESPVFMSKQETDESFNKAVVMCLKENEFIYTCLATHNQQSVELAIRLIEEFNITNHYEKVFFSQLFGMSDNLTFNLAKGHYNSSKYVPYGEVEKAIPYLLRRAEENSSIEGQTSRELELLTQEKSRRKQ